MILYRKVVYILEEHLKILPQTEKSYNGWWDIVETIYDEDEIAKYEAMAKNENCRFVGGAYSPALFEYFGFGFEAYREE